jgi:hypothetical protein
MVIRMLSLNFSGSEVDSMLIEMTDFITEIKKLLLYIKPTFANFKINKISSRQQVIAE